MGIVDRIIDLAKTQGITGVQIGELLGLSKSPLTDWKNGKSKPTLEQVTVLCEYFAIPSDYLLFGKKTQAILLHGGGGDKISQESIDKLDRATEPLVVEFLQDKLHKRVKNLQVSSDLLKLDQFMDWMNFP